DWVGEERLIAFSSEEAAREAALDGEITGYYLIQHDFIETGAVRYVREDFNPLSAMDSTGIIQDVIEFNLLGADPQRYQLYENPVQFEQVNLDPEELERDEDNILAFYLPYGVTMLFYVLILTSASLMLNSVAKEKENRVMEILISSLKPNQLLAGKILGLGLVGLLQMVVWLGSALILLRLGGTTLNIPPSLQLSPEIFFWGIPFFLLGYLLYATLMAGAGALVPNVKESTQATFIVVLPILVPLLMVSVIINQPDAPLPVILSLIPFTAPNTIMTRLAVTTVPLWQLLLSMALLGITIFFLIRAVANMFRAKLLLTGKKFNLGLYLKALIGGDLETSEPLEG
ncbi:MAG: ABC transporter permease, partial [Candidatus Thermoplasmatota archaeon]|nr:ABC transporter permease [Candidatus Thermoplasmatota archaeon]